LSKKTLQRAVTELFTELDSDEYEWRPEEGDESSLANAWRTLIDLVKIPKPTIKDQIITLLSENKYMTARQLHNEIGCELQTLRNRIAMMKKSGEILFQKTDGGLPLRYSLA